MTCLQVITVRIKFNGAIEVLFKCLMHLSVVLAGHHVVVVLPVPREAQVLLDRTRAPHLFTDIFNEHVLLDNYWVLGSRVEGYLLSFIPNVFAEELLVEGVISVIVFAQSN